MDRARRPAGTRRVPTAGALLALSAACGGGPSAPAPERTPRPLAVAAVRDLGPVGQLRGELRLVELTLE